MKPRNLAILGSTGSIGRNTLEVVDCFPGRFRVQGLTAGRNLELLAEQIARFRPKLVSIQEEGNRDALRSRLTQMGAPLPELLSGSEGMITVASDPEADLVVSATVGVAGLPATYEAVRLGKRVALANKEVLVAAGELMTGAAARSFSSFFSRDRIVMVL